MNTDRDDVFQKTFFRNEYLHLYSSVIRISSVPNKQKIPGRVFFLVLRERMVFRPIYVTRDHEVNGAREWF